MKAIEVLDRMDRLRAHLSLPFYQKYTDGVQRDIKKKRNGPTVTDQNGNPSGWLFCNREISRLNMAEAFFVTRDMQELIEGASLTLDETDQFAQDLWPSEYGFLLMEDGYRISDVRGETLVTHAITWGRAVARGKAGTMVVLYTDPRDMRDSINVKMIDKGMTPDRMALGDLVMTHLVWFADGYNVGPIVYMPGSSEEEIRARFGPDMDGKLPNLHEMTNDARFFLSLLLMLNQSITVLDRQAVTGRQDLKRVRRMKLPGTVTVVKLRRHSARQPDGEPVVEWQHSWIVRGHWRWQPYGQRSTDHEHELEKPIVVNGKRVRHCTRHGCDYHEDRIYINPFVKGPEDKPLKQTDKVYALVR